MPLNLTVKGWTDNNGTLAKVFVWRGLSDKLLTKQVMTYLTDEYMRRQPSRKYGPYVENGYCAAGLLNQEIHFLWYCINPFKSSMT